MGSYFSLAQWQELELQALIYRYMLAGAVVPPELLQPIKKSLVNSSPYFLHHPLQHYSHFQPACECHPSLIFHEIIYLILGKRYRQSWSHLSKCICIYIYILADLVVF